MSENALFSSNAVWIFVFILFYWAFCIFWGARSAQKGHTASDFFLAGRQLSAWVFIMGVTATSFAGWHFYGQPSLLLRDGFPIGYAAFAVIVVPLASILFFKRQWMLSKRFGYVTPGEMYAAYFQGNAVRIFTVIVALFFAIPFLGLLLGAAGFLVNTVTNGELSRDVAMWVLAIAILIYVAAGGIRAVAYVGTLQTILIAAATIILGSLALYLVGGFENLNLTLAKIAETSIGEWGTTRGYGGGDFNALFASPGVIQWTAGLGREVPVGGLWTGVMVMSFVLTFMGLAFSPAFSLWAFSAKDPEPFAPQQLWFSACAMGALLFFFVMFQGLGGLLLGGSAAVNEANLEVAKVLPAMSDQDEGRLAGELISLVAKSAPWLTGFLTVCVLIAIKASAGIFMAGVSATVARDLYLNFFNRSASDRAQKLCGRLTMLITTALALLMATFLKDGLIVLGSLALSLSVQLLPALSAVTWFSWLTRQGVTAGLIAGTVVVILTDVVGQRLTGGYLPWGQWPWTIHAAIWGLFANTVICLLASALARHETDAAHRQRFHSFLQEHAGLQGIKRKFVSLAWMLSLAWVFFAIGPGIIIGNYFFGMPGAGYADWDFKMPSIWAWQLLWWGLGILLVWFLAYKMEMSTLPHKEVLPVTTDIATTFSAKAAAGLDETRNTKDIGTRGYGSARS